MVSSIFLHARKKLKEQQEKAPTSTSDSSYSYSETDPSEITAREMTQRPAIPRNFTVGSVQGLEPRIDEIESSAPSISATAILDSNSSSTTRSTSPSSKKK